MYGKSESAKSFLLSIGNVRFIALVDVDVALAEEMT